MKALVLLHRWLGIGFCLLFAMWFASGIVMHFVSFPQLAEADRFAGLLPIDLSHVRYGPDEAVAVRSVGDARRVRLLQRVDGPVYVVAGASKLAAVHAGDLSDAAVTSEQLALDIARSNARQRGIGAAGATLDGVVRDDQWSVAAGFDPYRPLYRVTLNDADGTKLYVSSTTGEVVLAATRWQRGWNYVGSVAHWIYPTVLRRHVAAWEAMVWTLSLIALITALAGTVLGLARLWVVDHRLGTPFRGWHAWHHVLGLLTATFVVTWIFSGWLSMDDGLLFSSDRLSPAEQARVAAAPDWTAVAGSQRLISRSAAEVEWFALGKRLYRRERSSLDAQSIFAAGSPPNAQPFLSAEQVAAFVHPIAPDCASPLPVDPRDSYALTSLISSAPVYRSVCGDVWYDVDGATGKLIERLDSTRRSYRWLYGGLHTLNFPVLTAHPMLRSALIVGLCAIGLLFSITAAVIGWRRLRTQFC